MKKRNWMNNEKKNPIFCISDVISHKSAYIRQFAYI